MIEIEEKRRDEEEIVRLCRIIGEDKTTIAKLEEQRLQLEEVINKQNDLIETLWELYCEGE